MGDHMQQNLRPEDIRVDIIFRRHWNLRPNGVKITHLPSGQAFVSEDQRSEPANRAKCHDMLREFLRTWEPITIEEEFDALPEETKQKFYDLVSDTLDGFLWCSRVWESWYVGTMSKDDFSPAGDDLDVIHKHAVAAYKLHKELK